MPLAFDAPRRQGYKQPQRNCWICGNTLIYNYWCNLCDREAYERKWKSDSDETPILEAKDCYYYHPWQLKSAMWQEFLCTKKKL